jgi:hypothetical protein
LWHRSHFGSSLRMRTLENAQQEEENAQQRKRNKATLTRACSAGNADPSLSLALARSLSGLGSTTRLAPERSPPESEATPGSSARRRTTSPGRRCLLLGGLLEGFRTRRLSVRWEETSVTPGRKTTRTRTSTLAPLGTPAPLGSGLGPAAACSVQGQTCGVRCLGSAVEVAVATAKKKKK